MARNPVQASFDRWWNGVSLRAKVTGVTVLLLTIGLTVAGAGTLAVLRTYLLERVDEGIAAVSTGFPSGLDFDRVNSDYGEEYWEDRTYECADLEGHRWWFCQRIRG